MALTIEHIAPATAAEWDAVWTRCPYATYFHSREWAEVWSRYSRGKLAPAPLHVDFSDGERALLPGLTYSHGTLTMMRGEDYAAGLALAYQLDLAAGGTIVLVATAAFAISAVVGRARS